MSPDQNFRSPSSELAPSQNFVNSCSRCHTSYARKENLEKDAAKIFLRLDRSQDNSMPPEGSPERTALDSQPETLKEMKNWISGLAQHRPIAADPLQESLKSLRLPKGFHLSIFAKVPGARSIARSPSGVIYVGTGGLGGRFRRVYAIRDSKSQGVADQVDIILDGLNTPNGVAFKDGDLYVAEISRILRYKNIEAHLDQPGEGEVFNDSFPKEGHHGWKFIRFAPDGSLFVPVGAPCNVCLKEPTHAAIFKLSPDGKTKTLVSQGVRNTVGFDFAPDTGDLVFSENGRDNLGENIPPCEINRLPAKSWSAPTPLQPPMHYGFPYCHGDDIADPEFGLLKNCSQFTKPILNLGAHVAPLGLRFYTGHQFPKEYFHQIIFAEHGSWNRREPQGYRISMAWSKDGGKTFEYRQLIEGWLNADGSRWGRPVDLEMLPDGSMLISDDEAGVLYRLTYKAE
jgi:glucose/arabinose dehydrogenase